MTQAVLGINGMASFSTHSECHREPERWVDSQRHSRPDAASQRYTCACTSLRGIFPCDRQAVVGETVLETDAWHSAVKPRCH